MECQAALFSIPQHICYLNAAYMSPNLKVVAQAGEQAIRRKDHPFQIVPEDFFSAGERAKTLFARIIDVSDPQRIAIIPSVSYGLANVAINLPHKPSGEILLVADEFPSNVYVWQKLAAQKGYRVRTVHNSGETSWNAQILGAISTNTLVVSLSTVHWTNGYIFDLPAIRAKTAHLGIPLILDGTQSIGALPFSIRECPADALICAGYKWLLGPYSIGLAYYGPMFDHGLPLEENWMNRQNSEVFAHLTDYSTYYRPGAARYSVGESAHFIQLPMLIAALEQLLSWGVEAIQEYCLQLRKTFQEYLIKENLSFTLDFNDYAAHLFPVKFDSLSWTPNELNSFLRMKNIFVSQRGSYLRIAPHVYNYTAQMIQFVQVLKEAGLMGAFKY